MWNSFLILSFSFFLSSSLVGQTKNTTLKKLEAVCIVGNDVDFDYETRTEEIAQLFEANNVKVYRFYNGNNDWKQIKKAAENCTFFIYSGHGTNLGLEGGYGGMVVDAFISARQIVNELKFKKDAIIVYQSACGSAGSSSGDQGDIGLKKARDRVVGTATPFLLAGAKAYYANNYIGGAKDFVSQILDGKTMSEAFTMTTEIWNRIELHELLFDKHLPTTFHIGISSEKNWNKTSSRRKGYHIAYVGLPNFYLTELNILSKK